MRKLRRSSKSLTVPPFQMMNVLPLAGFSAVVSPRMTPSFTDQSRGSPSQLFSVLPSNRAVMPDGSGGAGFVVFAPSSADALDPTAVNASSTTYFDA